jgi:hypothetical protein
MKHCILFLFSALMLFPIINHAQTGFEPVLDTFFQYYGEGKTDEAVDYIFSTNKHLESSHQQKTALKDKMKTITQVIGDYYGYENILIRTAGKSYVIVKCMVMHDRQPMFFTFYLYKPLNDWQLQSLKFDDKPDENDFQ